MTRYWPKADTRSLGENALEETVEGISAFTGWGGHDDPVPSVRGGQPQPKAGQRDLVGRQVGDTVHAAVGDDDDQHLVPHIDQCDPLRSRHVQLPRHAFANATFHAEDEDGQGVTRRRLLQVRGEMMMGPTPDRL